MPDTRFLEFLRQQNVFGGGGMPPPANPMPRPMGGDVGQGVSNTSMDIGAMPPPQFGMPGIQAPDMGRQNPFDVPMGDTSFPPPQQFQPGQMPTPGQGMPEMDAGARMRELYQPTTDATERFEALVNAYPQDKNPSWLRRIASMITDYTHGPAAGQAMFDEPNRRAKEDWKNQVGPAQNAATNERYENVNSRTLANNQIAMELREKTQQAKEKNDETNTKIRQHRADIYEFKLMNPDYKFIIPKGGNVMAIDPRSGQAHDTGIPSGSMNELDKMKLTQENALDRISATGEQSRLTEDTRAVNRESLAETRGEEARMTRATPAGGGSKGEMPTQTKVRQYNAAREIINTNPELAKFVHITGTNEFTVDQPGQDFWGKPKGPTPEQSAKLKQLIFGATSPMSSHDTTNSTMTKTQTNTQTGEKRTMISTDGGKTWRVQ